MRGVFFIFSIFCFLFLSIGAEAVEVEGHLQGNLAAQGLRQELVFDAVHKGAWLRAHGGGSFLLEAGRLSFKPHGQIIFSHRGIFHLAWLKNMAHYTSQDAFRLLQKDNFGPATSALIFQADQITLGILRAVPLKGGEQADFLFCENHVVAGPVVLRGMQAKYTALDVVQAASIEGRLDWGPLRALVGRGWQQKKHGFAQASVAELRVGGKGHSLNFFWQHVEPGFVSLAAKSNKYTPDRRGWRVEATTNFAQVELSCNLRRHVNLAGTRGYDQLSLRLVSLGSAVSVELRLQPTRALIIRHATAAGLIQFDVLNGTSRCDGQLGNLFYGLRFDGPNGIGRLELKSGGGLNWRIIAKYDWLKERLHYSLMVRHEVARGHVQIELGEYDRGNMGAGFSTSPSLGISWQWKF